MISGPAAAASPRHPDLAGAAIHGDDLVVVQQGGGVAGGDHGGHAMLTGDDGWMRQDPPVSVTSAPMVGNSTDHTGEVMGQTSTSPGCSLPNWNSSSTSRTGPV
jgi:hypothetical protein